MVIPDDGEYFDIDDIDIDDYEEIPAESESVTSPDEPTNEKTPDDYLNDLKGMFSTDSKQKLTDSKKFIKSCLMDERKDFVETFIMEQLKNYFNLTKDDIKNLKAFYKAEAKQHSTDKITAALNAMIRNNDKCGISEEFDGLYEIGINQLTGTAVITPLHDKIAMRVINNKHVVMYRGNCFCYVDGCYKNDIYSVKAEATRILNGICKEKMSNGTNKRLDDVMTMVKNHKPSRTYPFDLHNNAIPVKNGVVVFDFNTETVTLEKHNPDKWKFSYILRVIYDDTASNEGVTPVIQEYTKDYKMLTQSVAQALLQLMGYGPYKKAYLLKGPKNCGKTTFLDIVERIIGKESTSKVALSELTPQNRFARSDMEGKVMNIDDDLGYFKMSETGIFKKLTGGYSQRIERKGVDGYDVTVTAVQLYTTNTPAGFDRRIFVDDAFWDRWCYIEFTHVYEKNDNFKQDLLTEYNISGYFNDIIQLMFEIRKLKQLPYVQPWTEVREKWTQESNVLFKFIEENMVSGGRTAIMKEDLLAALTKYCYDKAVDPQLIPTTVNKLGDLVEVCGGSKDAQRMFRGMEGKPHCYLLNYMWKFGSDYKKYAREEKHNTEMTTLSQLKGNNNTAIQSEC